MTLIEVAKAARLFLRDGWRLAVACVASSSPSPTSSGH
jgi:hypothetical protein